MAASSTWARTPRCSATYATATAIGVLTGVRRRGISACGRRSTATARCIAVAAFKLSRLVTKDKVTGFVRAPFTEFVEEGDGAEVNEAPARRGPALRDRRAAHLPVLLQPVGRHRARCRLAARAPRHPRRQRAARLLGRRRRPARRLDEARSRRRRRRVRVGDARTETRTVAMATCMAPSATARRESRRRADRRAEGQQQDDAGGPCPERPRIGRPPLHRRQECPGGQRAARLTPATSPRPIVCGVPWPKRMTRCAPNPITATAHTHDGGDGGPATPAARVLQPFLVDDALYADATVVAILVSLSCCRPPRPGPRAVRGGRIT